MEEFIEYIPQKKLQKRETKEKQKQVSPRNQLIVRNRSINTVRKQTKRWIVLRDGKPCNFVPISFHDAEAFANFITTKFPTSVIQIKPVTTLPEHLQRRIVPV